MFFCKNIFHTKPQYFPHISPEKIQYLNFFNLFFFASKIGVISYNDSRMEA